MALPKEMAAVKSKEANSLPLLIVDTPGLVIVIYGNMAPWTKKIWSKMAGET